MDVDWVWVFWEATITIDDPGEVLLLARATDHHGHVQPRDDGIYLDGSNAWPEIALTVVAAP